MLRLLLYFLCVATVLTVIRHAIILISEPMKRRSLRKQFGQDAPKTIEVMVSDWRSRFGRGLWFHLVGLPTVLFMIIVLIAQYA